TNQLPPPPPKPSATDGVTLSEAELKSKVGAYWNSRIEEVGRVTADAGKLRVNISGGNLTLVPNGANRFRIVEPGTEAEFEVNADGTPRRLLLNLPGQRPMVFDAVPPADAAQLSQFVGSYYSDEIDSTYRVTLKDDKLMLTRKKADPLTLQPVFRDAFATLSILGTVRFTRDAQNRVNGFTLHAGRIRSFKFIKRAE
ncbi:MAG TPA: hypothetical protein VFZ34_26915, partial [Blastocatellia bacterium]|nr:hypothetical protein [Blastocatellia bacterium]